MPREVERDATVFLPVVREYPAAGGWRNRVVPLPELVDGWCWSDPLAQWDAPAETSRD